MTTHFTGRLVLPSDPDFDDAVLGRVFNGRRPMDRRPEGVLFVADVADVQAGVRYAAERGLTVAVRSGGHSWAAWSVRQDSLLIDLGALNDAVYDETTGIVAAGPAIHGGDELDPFLAAHGRFFTGGHCPSVGIGGFLLQGGQGWNARGWGWAAENVVAVDVVTADGELVHAEAGQHADLYWAARGAGPAFPGVVVRFHLMTRARPAALTFTVQLYPIDLFESVCGWLYEIHEHVSPIVEIVAVSQTQAADAPVAPGERVFLVSALAFADSAAEGIAALEPFSATPFRDSVLGGVDAQPSRLSDHRAAQEAANPRGARYVVDNAWVDGDPQEIVASLRSLFVTPPTPKSFTIWFSMGPLRELPDMAFSLQAPAYIASYTVSDDPADDEVNATWLNGAFQEAQPVTVGQYLGDSDMTNRQLRFMGDDQWQRLLAIIADRDPEGRFVRYLARDQDSLNRNHWIGTV